MQSPRTNSLGHLVTLSSGVEYSDPLLPLFVHRRRALIAPGRRFGAFRRSRPGRLGLLVVFGDVAAAVDRGSVIAEVAGVLVVSLRPLGGVVRRRRGGRSSLVRSGRRHGVRLRLLTKLQYRRCHTLLTLLLRKLILTALVGNSIRTVLA